MISRDDGLRTMSDGARRLSSGGRVRCRRLSGKEARRVRCLHTRRDTFATIIFVKDHMDELRSTGVACMEGLPAASDQAIAPAWEAAWHWLSHLDSIDHALSSLLLASARRRTQVGVETILSVSLYDHKRTRMRIERAMENRKTQYALCCVRIDRKRQSCPAAASSGVARSKDRSREKRTK